MSPRKLMFFLLFCCIQAMILPSSAFAMAWRLHKNMWAESDEKIYEQFVEALCDSKYSNLNKFIRDSKANPLYGEDDLSFNLLPDCADLPYIIRAYVAYKLRLPFSYTSAIQGKGGDQRYSQGNEPTAFKNQSNFKSAQDLFYKVLLVNSGYFRIAASSNNSDHYPIKINIKTLVPGTIYYDPNGHVALVGKVTENGRIRLIDAHPDKSISKPWFGTKFNKGSSENGGGFKKWRPIRVLSDGRMVATQNHNLADYSNSDQYQKRYAIRGKNNLNYHEYVRETLNKSFKNDPMQEFNFMVQELYEDIVYRSIAVDLAIKKNLHLKPHPGALPYNIYGTDGIWEEFSTPSRDARLKVGFKELYDNTRQLISNLSMINYEQSRQIALNILRLYHELSSQYVIYYKNSQNRVISLSFDDVLNRLFLLSFDPYHSPELRWGATGAELASARDDETKVRFYHLEQNLRNNLERVYGIGTPISFGPARPIEVNIKNWLESYIRGEAVNRVIANITPEQIHPEAINSPQIQVARAIPIQTAQLAEQKTPTPLDLSSAAVNTESIDKHFPNKTNEVKTRISEKVAAANAEETSWLTALERIAVAVSNPENYSRK